MHAFTTYDIEITGTDKEISGICGFLKEKITDVDFEPGTRIHIRNTFKCVFPDEVVDLAKGMARLAKSSAFKMTGCIDTSESAGELMDFEIVFKDNNLTSRFSDWYVETSMESYEDYEDFNECFYECSPEEYKKMKEFEYVYLLETDDGDILSGNVPLGKELSINY